MSKLGLSSLLIVIFSFSAMAAENAKRLVILGDSLTEGYGVTQDEAYPALLQKKITAAGKKWLVVNAGISGSTSSSGVSRLTWQIKQKPDLVLLELGGNDGLRGQSVKAMEENLAATIALARGNSLAVILVGMRVPPNYGKKYSKDFAEVFPRLAKRFSIPLVPFLLDKVAGEPSLNQSDGIHPTAKGHVIVADTVFKAIQSQL